MLKQLSFIFVFLFLVTGASAYLTTGDGADGNVTITAANTIVNNYTTTTAAVSSGGTTFTLSSCTEFPNSSDILIMDMASTSKGRWQAFQRTNITPGCVVTFTDNQTINWTSTAAVQAIRVPNFDNLTINSGATITAPQASQSGKTGGVVAFRVKRYLDTTGSITVAGKGYTGGTNRVGCNGDATQGTDYDAAGGASNSANGAGGGGAHAGSVTCRVDGGGGAGQGGNGGQGGQTGTCTAAVKGQVGTIQVTNTSTYAWIEIAGGGGGGAVCNADGDSRAGGAGSGTIIVWANVSINLRADATGVGGTCTSNGDGDGGAGGSGSMYFDIHNVTFTSVTAPSQTAGTSGCGVGAGGVGIIAGHFNVTSGTTNPTLVNYGNFIPGNITSVNGSINYCTYSGSGNWLMQGSSACVIAVSQALLNNNITFNGTGTATITANITGWKKVVATNGCYVRVTSGGKIRP